MGQKLGSNKPHQDKLTCDSSEQYISVLLNQCQQITAAAAAAIAAIIQTHRQIFWILVEYIKLHNCNRFLKFSGILFEIIFVIIILKNKFKNNIINWD